MGNPEAGDPEAGVAGSSGRSRLILRTELREASASLPEYNCVLL